MKNFKFMKEAICFAGGLVFGTAGIKILSSKDAKKAYVHTVAAGLRMKECVKDTVNGIRENAEDVLAEAKQINDERCFEESSEVYGCEEAPEKEEKDV